MYTSKIPEVERHLEEQYDDQTIRSFIDSTDHLQFRCKCDEWYNVKVLYLDVRTGKYREKKVILFELECPLCGDKQKRKMYIDMQIYSSDIENFINEYPNEFGDSSAEQKELLHELGCLRLDLDLLMEDIGKDNNLKVPAEDEIIEQLQVGFGRKYGLSEEQMEIKKRQEENGFNQYISKKYGRWGRINLHDGLSEFDILLMIHNRGDLDEEDKQFLTENELEKIQRLNEDLKGEEIL